MKPCRNLACPYGGVLPERPGRGRYCTCSDECAEALKRLQGAAWQYLRRHELNQHGQNLGALDRSRRELLTYTIAAVGAYFLDQLPTNRYDRQEWIEQKLLANRTDLAESDLGVALPRIERNAYALLKLLASERSPLARRARIHCLAVLRDAGAVGEKKEALGITLERSALVKKHWAAEGDYVRLAEALVAEANILRIRDDEQAEDRRKVWELLHWAEHLLTCYGNPNDLMVQLILHRCVFGKLHHIAAVREQPFSEAARREYERLQWLTEQIDTPLTHVQGLNESVAYQMRQFEAKQGDSAYLLARAPERLIAMHQAFSDLPAKGYIQPACIPLDFGKSEIELYLHMGDTTTALELGHQCLSLSKKDGNTYTIDQLRTLQENDKTKKFRLDGLDGQPGPGTAPLHHSCILVYSHTEKPLLEV